LDSSHDYVKGNTHTTHHAVKKESNVDETAGSYLRDVDASLLERAVIGVLSAHVAILAPVAWERAVHTGEAARTERDERRRIESAGVTCSPT